MVRFSARQVVILRAIAGDCSSVPQLILRASTRYPRLGPPAAPRSPGSAIPTSKQASSIPPGDLGTYGGPTTKYEDAQEGEARPGPESGTPGVGPGEVGQRRSRQRRGRAEAEPGEAEPGEAEPGEAGPGRYTASAPRSPVRTRTTSSIGLTQTFPSPMEPVRAAATIASSAPSTTSSFTTTSTLVFGTMCGV